MTDFYLDTRHAGRVEGGGKAEGGWQVTHTELHRLATEFGNYLFDKWTERFCNAPRLPPDFTTHITCPWVVKENQQNSKVSDSDTER